MKKILTFVLVTCLVTILVLSGCGEEETTTTTTTTSPTTSTTTSPTSSPTTSGPVYGGTVRVINASGVNVMGYSL
ncbi:MAG: hypothetical protein PVJ08_07920, partial [Dehalococcoidia bacterium]